MSDAEPDAEWELIVQTEENEEAIEGLPKIRITDIEKFEEGDTTWGDIGPELYIDTLDHESRKLTVSQHPEQRGFCLPEGGYKINISSSKPTEGPAWEAWIGTDPSLEDTDLGELERAIDEKQVRWIIRE